MMNWLNVTTLLKLRVTLLDVMEFNREKMK